MFYPEEVIFCPTNRCNLHCGHCTVTRWKDELTAEQAVAFLEDIYSWRKEKPSSRKYSENVIEKASENPADETNVGETNVCEDPFYVGFSGGEPCLDIDFICTVCEKAVNLDFYFDRITTNGQWWKTEAELEEKLGRIYEYGFDGKFGLSWDSFHGGDKVKLMTFARNVCEIFGPSSLDILSVINPVSENNDGDFFSAMEEMADDFGGELINELDEKNGKGQMHITFDDGSYITIYRFPESYREYDSRAWKNSSWFTDDFCQSTGNVFYVHSNGLVAPCCGFANESEKLFLGKVTEGAATLMKNARNSKVVELCFCHGLEKFRKELEQKGTVLPGVTDDLCTFCDYICNRELI